MQVMDIVILTAGFIFIIVSFFLIEQNKPTEQTISEEERHILLEAELKECEKKITELLNEKTSDYMIEVENKLSSLANEKIMAVDEFSQQLLAKLEGNHQEVVFLYDMMMNKEEEMKSTLNRMEVVRKENQVFMDKIIELRDAKIKAMGKSLSEKRLKKEVPVIKEEPEEIKIVEEPEKFVKSKTKLQEKEELSEELKHQILTLYAEKKSIKEISRKLSVGQGEVKLIVDLYG